MKDLVLTDTPDVCFLDEGSGYSTQGHHMSTLCMYTSKSVGRRAVIMYGMWLTTL